jgi:hypothetical protein
MTVSQLIKERKKYIRVLKNQMRYVDSAQEKSERLLKRLLSRKLKVPEEQDLKTLVDQAEIIAGALQTYLGYLRSGYPD